MIWSVDKTPPLSDYIYIYIWIQTSPLLSLPCIMILSTFKILEKTLEIAQVPAERLRFVSDNENVLHTYLFVMFLSYNSQSASPGKKMVLRK